MSGDEDDIGTLIYKKNLQREPAEKETDAAKEKEGEELICIDRSIGQQLQLAVLLLNAMAHLL